MRRLLLGALLVGAGLAFTGCEKGPLVELPGGGGGGGGGETLSFTFLNPPSGQVMRGNPITMRAMILDDTMNPVGGVAVSFTVSPATGSGTLDSATVTTSAQGVADVTLNAAQNPTNPNPTVTATVSQFSLTRTLNIQIQ